MNKYCGFFITLQFYVINEHTYLPPKERYFRIPHLINNRFHSRLPLFECESSRLCIKTITTLTRLTSDKIFII